MKFSKIRLSTNQRFVDLNYPVQFGIFIKKPNQLNSATVGRTKNQFRSNRERPNPTNRKPNQFVNITLIAWISCRNVPETDSQVPNFVFFVLFSSLRAHMFSLFDIYEFSIWGSPNQINSVKRIKKPSNHNSLSILYKKSKPTTIH